MRIRFAEPADTRELAELWCDAFPGKRSVADRMRMLEIGGRYGGLETVILARDERGRLAAACKIYRMLQMIAGRPLPMMGLAAVAVAPFARRRGLGGRICGEAMAEARSRGDLISSLYPFRPDYYRRLGWGLTGRIHEHRIETIALPDDTGADRVRSARRDQDAPAIAVCYERAIAQATGPIERDSRVWAYRLSGEELGVRPVEEGAGHGLRGDPSLRMIVYEDDDGITGYALLRQRSARSPAEQTLEVRELVAETESAYRGLLGHLARQADQWPWTLHHARSDERFADRLSDPRPPRYRVTSSLHFPTSRVLMGPMLRLIDVRGALAQRTWFQAERVTGSESSYGADITIAIDVDDPQVGANRGRWTVRPVGNGEAAVESGASERATASLAADAATLARIYAGEITPTDAARIGHARIGGDAALLDRAFATAQAFWLPDTF